MFVLWSLIGIAVLAFVVLIFCLVSVAGDNEL